MSNLQPKQFYYHASKRNLTPGVDQITPVNMRDGKSHYGYGKADRNWGEWDSDEDRGDWAFAADTEREAESWSPSSQGRPTTYVVKPAEGVETRTETHHHQTGGLNEGAHHIKARGPMDIVDRIDIPMTPSRTQGWSVQGTLPPVDWNRYRNRDINDASRVRKLQDEHYGRHDSGNSLTLDPERAAAAREAGEMMAESDAIYKRHDEEQAWLKAGQQHLFEG